MRFLSRHMPKVDGSDEHLLKFFQRNFNRKVPHRSNEEYARELSPSMVARWTRGTLSAKAI